MITEIICNLVDLMSVKAQQAALCKTALGRPPDLITACAPTPCLLDSEDKDRARKHCRPVRPPLTLGLLLTGVDGCEHCAWP